jgi:hypothetical protein
VSGASVTLAQIELGAQYAAVTLSIAQSQCTRGLSASSTRGSSRATRRDADA